MFVMFHGAVQDRKDGREKVNYRRAGRERERTQTCGVRRPCTVHGELGFAHLSFE